MTDIPIRYVGQDNTGAASSSAKRNIENVGRAAQSGTGGVKGMNKALAEMSPAGRAASHALEGMGGNLKSVSGLANIAGTAIKGMVAGAVIGQVVQLGRALADLGVQAMAAQELEGAFQSVAATAGLVADDVLESMRRASEGMVSNAELVAVSNRAIMMKAVDSTEEMTALMEIAKVRSDAVGISVGEAFGALAEGIGRVSERQLYGLGIQLDMQGAMEEYASALGTTADKLSEAQKRQALYNAVVADSADLVEQAGASGMSNADKMDQFAASWANLKQTIGELVAGPLADFFSLMNEGLTQISEGIEAQQDVGLEKQLFGQIGNIDAAFTLYKERLTRWEELRDLTEQITGEEIELPVFPEIPASDDLLGQSYNNLIRIAEEYNKTAEALGRPLLDLEQMRAGIMAFQDMTGATSLAGAEAAAAAQKVQEAAKAVDLLQQVYGHVEAVQAFYAAQQEVRAAAEAAGLTQAQLNAILAQGAAQYAVLTDATLTQAGAGYTAAEANEIVTQSMLDAVAGKEVLQGALYELADTLSTVIPAAAMVAAEAVQSVFASAMAGISAMWGAVTNVGPTTAPDARSAKRGRTSPGMVNPEMPGKPTTGMPAPLDRLSDSAYFSAVKSWDDAAVAASKAASKASRGFGSAGGAAETLADKFDDLSGSLQGMLDKVPGLTSPSEVTEEQMKLAKMGIPQNFADDYLRQLTDEVLNGVDWAGVDIGDAAARAGIDPNLPSEVILEMFKNAWADNSLFANAGNLDLINMDAVKASLQQQMAAQQGKANLMALFGIGSDQTVQAVAGLGLEVQSGLSQWLTENGMADAGAKLAAALGAGVGESTAVGEGTVDGMNNWLGTDSASAALTAFGKSLGDRIPPVHVKTVLDPPENPPAPPGGDGAGATGAPPGGAAAGAATTTGTGGGVRAESVADALFNGALNRGKSGPQVVVNAVINTPMDEAQFKRMMKDVLRKGTART